MAVQSHENFPLDFDSLEIGDIISPEFIEKVYDVKRDSPHYDLKKMSLRSIIMREAAHIPYVKTHKQYALICLGHDESATHLVKQHESSLRKMGNLLRYTGRINHSEINQKQQERLVHMNRRVLAALDEDRRQRKLLRITKGSTSHAQLKDETDGGRSDPSPQQPIGQSPG